MLQIRRAAPDDAESLAAIGIRTYLDHYREFWSPPGLQRFLDQHFSADVLAAHLADPNIRYELVFDADDLVGFSKTLSDRPVPGVADRRGAELHKIYFTAAAVGRGFGTRLIEHICRSAREQGQARIWLNVLKTNEAGVRFYERMDFVRVGEMEFATDDARLGMWVMLRELRTARA